MKEKILEVLNENYPEIDFEMTARWILSRSSE